MALTLDGTNGIVSSGSITTQSSSGVIFSDSSALTAAASPYVLKNRIINGDMRIDQRNAGASVSTSSGASIYTVDRWQITYSQTSKMTAQQNAGSVTPPVGFSNYIGFTSSSAYTVGAADYFQAQQTIEGFNTADLAWGTANAKTITISFWAYSSLTGNFGLWVTNSATNRVYPTSYTISSANTWTYCSVTIPGDTSGTWLTTNGIGIRLVFNLGYGSSYVGSGNAWNAGTVYQPSGCVNLVATNGATLYITGVQLEVGSTATPFERRLYNQELANCQRYYEKGFGIDVVPASANADYWNGGGLGVVAYQTNFLRTVSVCYRVEKRATPTVTLYNPSGLGTSGNWAYYPGAWSALTTSSIETAGSNTNAFNVRSSVTGTTGQTYIINGGWTASAEL